MRPVTEDELRAIVRERMHMLGMTQTEYAKHIGIGRVCLCNFLNSNSTPGDKLLARLGLAKQTRYIPRDSGK